MDILHEKLHERNVRETIPFVSIYESYTSLLNLTDHLQTKCTNAEQKVEQLRQQLLLLQVHDNGGGNKSTTATTVSGTTTTTSTRGGTITSSSSVLNQNNTAFQSVMKNETRLREKLEQLQLQYDEKVEDFIAITNTLHESQSLNTKNEIIIQNLNQELGREKITTERLLQQLKDAEMNSNLLEDQNQQLKITFRTLQDENIKLRNENSMYEERLVREKGKVVDEMNELTGIMERLKAEVESLRSSKSKSTTSNHGESSRAQPQSQNDSSNNPLQSWFGSIGSHHSPKRNVVTDKGSSTKYSQDDMNTLRVDTTNDDDGNVEMVLVPSQIQQTIVVGVDGTFVRYDHSVTDCNVVVTASNDGTVKLWDTTTTSTITTTGMGQQQQSLGIFRGTPNSGMTCCDISSTLVVGGGTDRSCRVWDRRNDRMIHQLVGHQNKITCVRLYGDDTSPSVITGSADHTLKVWDISRKTYKQNITLQQQQSSSLSTTAMCVDVVLSSDDATCVTGHMDGKLRRWDLRSGQLTAEMTVMHDGGISSIQFKPNDDRHVLTHSVDSSLKIIDLRVLKSIHTFSHEDVVTTTKIGGQLLSGCCSTFSPDGRYIASGLNSNILIWDTLDRSLKTRLSDGHTSSIVSIDWSRCGGNQQQIASLDRKGRLILWGS